MSLVLFLLACGPNLGLPERVPSGATQIADLGPGLCRDTLIYRFTDGDAVCFVTGCGKALHCLPSREVRP